MSTAATVQDLFNKKPVTAVIDFIADPDLAAQWNEANDRLEVLQQTVGRLDELALVQKEVDDLKPLVIEATRFVRLKAIGRKPYDELMDEHPITDEQKAEAEAAGDTPGPYNPDTFLPALVSASAVDPELSFEQAKRLLDSPEYNTAEVNTFVITAMRLNNRSRTFSLGKGSERTLV